MATKLPVNTNTWDTKHLWNKHQADEFKKVNNYKEGYCYNCFKNRAVGATLVDICEKCFNKRGVETILAEVVEKEYGLCFFCGDYHFHIMQYNVRLCERCNRAVGKLLRTWNEKGGMYGNDPFWKSMMRRNGKDWKQILFQPPKSRGL